MSIGSPSRARPASDGLIDWTPPGSTAGSTPSWALRHPRGANWPTATTAWPRPVRRRGPAGRRRYLPSRSATWSMPGRRTSLSADPARRALTSTRSSPMAAEAGVESTFTLLGRNLGGEPTGRSWPTASRWSARRSRSPSPADLEPRPRPTRAGPIRRARPRAMAGFWYRYEDERGLRRSGLHRRGDGAGRRRAGDDRGRTRPISGAARATCRPTSARSTTSTPTRSRRPRGRSG